MKTILGIGTALTLAVSPMALSAEPTLRLQGGGAVVQMLNAAIAGNAKELHKAEKRLRKAARKAGVPVSVSTVTAAATGGAAAATQRTSTRRAAPAPVLAPSQVAHRPQPRPVAFGPAPVEIAAAPPPVTTVRNGSRVQTTALDTAPETTPVARRVATAPVQTAAIPDASTATPSAKVVRAESSTDTSGAPTGQQVAETAANQPAPVQDETSPFGGPTGY